MRKIEKVAEWDDNDFAKPYATAPCVRIVRTRSERGAWIEVWRPNSRRDAEPGSLKQKRMWISDAEAAAAGIEVPPTARMYVYTEPKPAKTAA